jgi:hypothetical protein
VTHTEHTAKTPSPKTGLFAALRAALHIAGTGGSSSGNLAILLPRNRITLLVQFLLSLLLTPMVFVGSAQAAVTHEFLSRISEVPPGSGAAVTGPLDSPGAMAVDSGELYIANGAENAILDKFNASSGAFILQAPQLPSPLEYLYQGVAVGHSGGETQVYVGGDELTEEGPRGVVAVLEPSGALKHVWRGAETGAPGGTFGCFECGASGDVAVDSSAGLGWAVGDVYVADPKNTVVDVFEPETGGGEKYVTQLTGTEPGAPFIQPTSVAVDPVNGEVLIVDNNSTVDVFKPATLANQYEFLGALAFPSGPSERIKDVTVDGGNGDIYVSETERNTVYQFSAEGSYLGRLTGTPAGPLEHMAGVAVDPESHNVYVGVSASTEVENETTGFVDVFGPNIVIPDVTTGAASGLSPASATLNGTVNPDKAGEATCRFEWGTSTEFGKVAPCEPEDVADGGSPVAVHAAVSGLQPDTTYFYRLQATNKANGHTNPGEPSQDQSFTTPGPSLEGGVSSVASTSATLEATVNPHGASTSYYFQYGTSTGYGFETPASPGIGIGSGEGGVEVSRPVQGLLPRTVYHYRVVVVSELEVQPGVFGPVVFDGADQSFTTQASGGLVALPDGRAWELVSPVDKHGSVLQPLNGIATQASASGGAITYVGTLPFEAAPPGYTEYERILSRRGAGGWSSQNFEPPHATSPGVSAQEEYRYFSEDLSVGLYEPIAAFISLSPEVSPPDSEQTIYLRHNDTCVATPATCFTPLLTSAPGYANVPPGTKFGEYESHLGTQFLGATPDLSHVILKSHVALTSTPAIGGLYEWTAGQLQLLSVLPAEEGGTPVEGDPGEMAYGTGGTEVSGDGSRVVWQTLLGSSGWHLYLRDLARGETVRLDVPQPGASGMGTSAPLFQSANGDGSRVFFTDTQRLTVDSGAREGQADLYECTIVESAGKDGCVLSDVTPAVEGRSPSVQGNLLGASKDDSWMYFVANGVLGDGAEHGAVPGHCAGQAIPIVTCNLYVLHDGQIRFVSVLSSADNPDWAVISQKHTARVSDDGRFLAFMSERPLTGYDNRDANSGQRDEEVFLFDATTGRLSCASCNPTGARPVGVEDTEESMFLTGGVVWGSGKWLAGNIPGWTGFINGWAVYQSRFLSDSGRLFFNSHDALVPRDVNNNQDVYEFEPLGVGDCREDTRSGSVVFAPGSGGCVGLISSGTAVGESGFLDASEDGSDVFFLTGERLVPEDVDTSVDLYDAHVCSPGSPCVVPAVGSPACVTVDACRAAPLAQPSVFGSPSSATFSGAGNITPPAPAPPAKPKTSTRAQLLAKALKACRKKHDPHKRLACAKQAHKRYSSKSSKGRK